VQAYHRLAVSGQSKVVDTALHHTQISGKLLRAGGRLNPAHPALPGRLPLIELRHPVEVAGVVPADQSRAAAPDSCHCRNQCIVIGPLGQWIDATRAKHGGLKLFLAGHSGFAGEVRRFLGIVQSLIHFESALVVLDVDPDTLVVVNQDALHITVRTTTAMPADDVALRHIRIGWLASTEIYIEVGGIRVTNTTTIDAAPTLDATMYFTADDASGTNRADVMISEVQITDKIHAPRLPFALGAGAKHMSKVSKT
jgi:hypothetical protein